MIRKLTIEESDVIYHTHMKRDFPPEELKPFARIRDMQTAGFYTMWAQETTNGTLQAYACLCRVGSVCLLDYYAVVADARAQGIGSRFLQELTQTEVRDTRLLIELEDPAAATTEAARAERLRRIRFYERLGYVATGFRIRLFQVVYLLYSQPLQDGERAALKEQFLAIYEQMLPKALRDAHVKISEVTHGW